ncbi:gamma-glutamyltransferase [Metaplanococcus flavidus]|uniref:Glutathione hydrolase proenzyme n=1 Tax=Metaplanococcus flavidus TaxID=569883 RepID=A0ABW3LAM6_9BACL
MDLQRIIQNQKAHKHISQDETAAAKYGMAASAIKEATEIGEQVLEDGGNAIDAIIAIQFALSVVEGMNTGIAAGGFLIHYDSESKKTIIIDGHSQAPSEVTPELFVNEEGEAVPFDERSTSAKAVGVPGIMKMMNEAHERYGSMPLERLVDPAIELAENEYEVNSLWERTIEQFKDRMGEETKKVFMPNGKPLKEGDKIRQPDLAKTLKIIKEHGFNTVYEGEIADAMLETIESHGGLMTKEDMQNYKVAIREPLWSTYKELDLAFPPPPNVGGFTIAQMLKILEPFKIEKYHPHSWEKYHLLSEVMRLTLADKEAYMGDPEFIDIPMEGLFHPKYIEERRNRISFDERLKKVKEGDPWDYEEKDSTNKLHGGHYEEGMETTHFTAVDHWGNIAACTSSIERIFGSGIMVPGYGFLLNNDLTDFNPEPGTKNEPNAKKYAISSKAPTIVFHEGKPFFTLGSPGATTIVASVLQVLLNVVEYKMDLKEAIEEPRIYITPDLKIQWEDGINDEAMEKLTELGYELDRSYKEVTADTRVGDVQAILIDPETGHTYGAADSPRPGEAAGPDEPPEE